ncbi:hypothetical protein [Sphingomonas sp. Ant20]|nr:hypothetical protein [Sphingomonas sp. Ant20]
MTQAWRCPQCGWSRSRETRAAGASVAVMPSAAQPRAMASAAALRATGG